MLAGSDPHAFGLLIALTSVSSSAGPAVSRGFRFRRPVCHLTRPPTRWGDGQRDSGGRRRAQAQARCRRPEGCRRTSDPPPSKASSSRAHLDGHLAAIPQGDLLEERPSGAPRPSRPLRRPGGPARRKPAPHDGGRSSVAPSGTGPWRAGPAWPDRAGPWRGRLRNAISTTAGCNGPTSTGPSRPGSSSARSAIPGVPPPARRDRAGGGRRPGARSRRPGDPDRWAARGGSRRAVASARRLPSPVAMRRQLRTSARAVMPVRTDVYVTGRVIPGRGDAPPIPVRVYRQFGPGLGSAWGRSRPLPAIVYYHGGGWVSADLDSHDALCRLLAAVSGASWWPSTTASRPSIRSRLPSTTSLTAYAWVHEPRRRARLRPGPGRCHGRQRRRQPGRGGGARGTPGPAAGQRVPPPVAQGLVYPAVDARLRLRSRCRSMAEGFLLTEEHMEFFRDQLPPRRSDWE